MASGKPTRFWGDEETRFMLRQIQELNILNFLDGRKSRNANLFKKIAKAMADAGFIKTTEQIKIKWKNTQKSYVAAKRIKTTTGAYDPVICPYFRILDEQLGSPRLSQVVKQEEEDVDPSDQEAATEMSHDDSTQRGLDEPCKVEETSRSSSPLQRNSELPEAATEMSHDDSTQRGLDEPCKVEETSRSSSPLQRNSELPEAATEMGGDDSTQRGFDEACKVESAETSWSSSPLQRNSELPETSVQRPRRRRRGQTDDVALLCEQIAESRDFWRHQLRESDERQERLLTTLMEGTNNMFGELLESIRSLRPPAPTPPPQPMNSTPQPMNSTPQPDAPPAPSTPSVTSDPPNWLQWLQHHQASQNQPGSGHLSHL
ncbi:protein ALEX-like [Cololabis saira]|uniref:protein ALEX-like n=1 Tax=Cololabis saira TaxID=129043 RepID=UPI002AD32351|nr:protein ALEX-like [Cololabis saira]